MPGLLKRIAYRKGNRDCFSLVKHERKYVCDTEVWNSLVMQLKHLMLSDHKPLEEQNLRSKKCSCYKYAFVSKGLGSDVTH